MKIFFRYSIKIIVILIWILVFYLQFGRPAISHAAQHISPALLFSSLPHALFWIIWLSVPLIIFAILKGRYFCWHICPVGLVQDIIPSKGKIKSEKVNIYIFISLFSASFFLLNFMAIFDPLVTFNRAIISLKLQIGEFLIFFLPIAIIILLSIYKKRFWCYKLCPLGVIAEFLHKRKKIDIDKRKTLIAIGTGILLGGLVKIINYTPKKISDRLLRPPGALPEDKFTDRCIRCGSCIAVCLTGTLTPAIFNSGLEGIFTPRLVPQIAECDENCNKCGQSCPTQAIRNLPLDKKKNFKIGTAKIDRALCLGWSKNILCLVCNEFCPYLAIKAVKNNEDILCPQEIPELCRGCGLCEKNCPARPQRAIVVFNNGAGDFIHAGKIIPRQNTLL